ncbi:MAG TPA: hypothetical protein VLB44_23890 [Kofleriaceae bacterium]|nr:hypothetical protein [Kofleriaceae bacterium]
MRLAIFAVGLAACSSGGGPDMSTPDADIGPDASSVTADAPITSDVDGDGLADDLEDQLARDYLPYVSLDPGDGCALSGFVARVRPHPKDATKILIVYSHLFQEDCGLGGHVGDNEAFGIAIDPNVPAPAGILAIRAASHQGTLCQRTTECSTCAGDSRTHCDLATDGGMQWPVVYASKDKHGQYASKSGCPLLGTCFDQCTLNPQRDIAPVVNVGEPTHHMVGDLTAQGFITPANGWTEPSLMNFDPWNAMQDFGGAGNIAGDLQDSTFEPAPCP